MIKKLTITIDTNFITDRDPLLEALAVLEYEKFIILDSSIDTVQTWEYQVIGNYGSGIEVLTTEPTKAAAIAVRNDYRDNDQAVMDLRIRAKQVKE